MVNHVIWLKSLSFEQKYKFKIIEDASHAIGKSLISKSPNRKSENSDVACYLVFTQLKLVKRVKIALSS